MYVQAVDGMLYKNPLLYGADWFAVFCDDEEPEIVVERKKSYTEKKMREEATNRLRGAGIDHKISCFKHKAGRLFPPTYKVRDASAFFFTLLAPIPIPKPGGVRVSPARLDDECLIFYYDFDTRDVLSVLAGEETNGLLEDALLPRSGFHYKSRKTKLNQLRKEIAKAFPEIESADPLGKTRVEWRRR